MRKISLKNVKNTTISSLFAGIVVIMAMFLAIACEKDEARIEKTNPDSSPQSILYNLKVDEDGIIVFKDFEERKIVMDELMKMTTSEIKEWEHKIGFQSYETFLNEAEHQIVESNDKDSFYEVLNNYKEYFYLKTLTNGDVSVERRFPSTLYLQYCNKDGLFIVGDSIFKVGSSSFVFTHINNRAEIENLSSDDIKRVASNNTIKKLTYCNDETILVKYGSMIDGEAIYDPNGWKNDRYCRLKLIAYYEYISNGQGRAMVKSHVYGKKKNIFGNYVAYNTILSHKDISFEVRYRYSEYGADHDEYGTINDYQGTEEEENHYGYYQVYYPVTMDEGDNIYTIFLSGFGKGSHRGMNNIWAIINKP